MELGRCVLCCCNAFTWEPCLSIINNSASNLEHAAICARVSCQKRSFSPCGDNEATEAWQISGKVCACVHVHASLCLCWARRTDATWNRISLQIIDQTFRLRRKIIFHFKLSQLPQKESHPLWSDGVKKDKKHSTNQSTVLLRTITRRSFGDFWREIIHVPLKKKKTNKRRVLKLEMPSFTWHLRSDAPQ